MTVLATAPPAHDRARVLPQRVIRYLLARPALAITGGLLLLLAALRVVVVLGRRVPMGHDAFQYLQLQYVFFNEAVLAGSPPQWLPFMTYGSVSNVWVLISQGLLVGALYPLAPLFGEVNFLYLYNAGLLFDEFVLLLGCVLLGRRYFTSWAAVLFSSAAVTFTASAATQPWYDFHLFYLLPLLLYCADRALRDASARYLFLFGALSVATLLGNLPYFLPFTAFTLLVFAAAAAATAPREALSTILAFAGRLSWRHALAVALPAALGGALLLYLHEGRADIVFRTVGRSQSGAVLSFTDFLGYGGPGEMRRYLELVGRYSNNIDNTIYSGMLVVPFAVLSLLRVRSGVAHAFAITALVIFLFARGTLVSAAFYHLFPLGTYFRHVGLVAPTAMLFLAFYAGFGVDSFWASMRRLREGRAERVSLLAPLATLTGAFLLVLGERWHWFSVFDFGPWAGTPTSNQHYLSTAQIDAALTAVLLLIAVYVAVLLAMTRWPRHALPLAVVLLTVHVADVFTRKVELDHQRLPAVEREVVDLFRPQAYRFDPVRGQDYTESPRFVSIAPAVFANAAPPAFDGPYPPVAKYGSLYWTMDSFVYLDAGASIFRADHWLRGVDALYSAFLSPDTRPEPMHRGFPVPASIAYAKLSGLGFPKLQLFSGMHALPDDSAVASVFADPDFGGDQLLASARRLATPYDLELLSGPASALVSAAGAAGFDVRGSDRLPGGSIAVDDFSFDRLRISVDTGTRDDWALLYYADSWSANWRASVNGEPAPVLRASIAYKAIPVPPGTSEVILWFGDRRTTVLMWSTVVAALAAVGAVGYLASTLARRTPPGAPSENASRR